MHRWPGSIRHSMFGERERASGNPSRCVLVFFSCFFLGKTTRGVCRSFLHYASGRPGADCGTVRWLVAYKQHLRRLVLHLDGVTHRLQSLVSHRGATGSDQSCGRKPTSQRLLETRWQPESTFFLSALLSVLSPR